MAELPESNVQSTLSIPASTIPVPLFVSNRSKQLCLSGYRKFTQPGVWGHSLSLKTLKEIYIA